MYLTEEACQSVRGLPSEFQISAGDEVRLTASEAEESCGSATQIAVHVARFSKPRLREIMFSWHHRGQSEGFIHQSLW
jgi:hypothetical protein